MRGLKYGASVGAYARFLCVYFGVYATETDVVYATETDVSSSYIVSFFARCLLGKGNNFMDMVTVNSAYYDKQDTSNEYAGRKFDCINSTNSAHPVPVNVEEVKDIVSVAKYILIVEKESVFQRLANDHFCKKKNQCIVITGRGYPDVPTRRSPHYCACILGPGGYTEHHIIVHSIF
ncbi:hypothetical protein POM88_052992 [Heracleum sosnowskyi]|uniref:Topoisomerase 6 subunit A/Spo11 TOPRIM domain-containing protein n=1 Tax=Heracleum sosnowskyi TaxID=360622 RepID=A0AAD8GRF6_9APIA|nr:hypothetical protein POM88_052992 [Heracleum sosnowskyi]